MIAGIDVVVDQDAVDKKFRAHAVHIVDAVAIEFCGCSRNRRASERCGERRCGWLVGGDGDAERLRCVRRDAIGCLYRDVGGTDGARRPTDDTGRSIDRHACGIHREGKRRRWSSARIDIIGIRRRNHGGGVSGRGNRRCARGGVGCRDCHRAGG